MSQTTSNSTSKSGCIYTQCAESKACKLTVLGVSVFAVVALGKLGYCFVKRQYHKWWSKPSEAFEVTSGVIKAEEEPVIKFHNEGDDSEGNIAAEADLKPEL